MYVYTSTHHTRTVVHVIAGDDAAGRVTGTQYAYTQLRRRVLSLELAPGSRLLEEEAAASLGVSRTPLREAIRQLLAEGLLERHPTGSVQVPVLSAESASELYDVRAALESLMAGTAAGRATEADIVELEGIVSRNQAMVSFPDDAMRLGTALHEAVAQIAGNAWASRLHAQVSDQIARYRPFTNRSSARRLAALEGHRAIVACIAAGDTERAMRAAEDHVLEAKEEAIRSLRMDADR